MYLKHIQNEWIISCDNYPSCEGGFFFDHRGSITYVAANEEKCTRCLVHSLNIKYDSGIIIQGFFCSTWNYL